jgi:hypothetical protein
MVQRDSYAAQAGGRIWNHPCDTGFVVLQAHRMHELWDHRGFHPDFKGRPERSQAAPKRIM